MNYFSRLMELTEIQILSEQQEGFSDSIMNNENPITFEEEHKSILPTMHDIENMTVTEHIQKEVLKNTKKKVNHLESNFLVSNGENGFDNSNSELIEIRNETDRKKKPKPEISFKEESLLKTVRKEEKGIKNGGNKKSEEIGEKGLENTTYKKEKKSLIKEKNKKHLNDGQIFLEEREDNRDEFGAF